MRRSLMWLLIALLAVPSACLSPRLGDEADRQPLGVEWLSLGNPALGEVPVARVDDELRVRFTDQVDPTSVSGDTAMIVAGRSVGACAASEGCPEGLCVEGECFWAPVDDAFLKDANRPPLGASRKGRVVPSEQWITADGRELRLRSSALLARPGRYALVLSAALRDKRGNPLCDPEGLRCGVVAEFVTGLPGGPRPELHLISPVPGAAGIPTNLAWVVAGVTGEVGELAGDGLWLEGAGSTVGGEVSRIDSGCPAPYVACYRLALSGSLGPLLPYRLGQAERLRDAEGRPIPTTSSAPFFTGPGPDEQAPEVKELSWEPEGGCLEVRVTTNEPTRAELRWSGSQPGGVRLEAFALEHRALVPLEEPLSHLLVFVWDAVGNEGHRGPEPLDLASGPAVAITEVLANPAGTEPAEEFVEIVNLGPTAVSLEGWSLTDTLAKPGDLLPADSLPPGAVGLVVPSTFQGLGGKDPAPAPGTRLFRLENSTLGYSGLSNSGEPVYLRDGEGRVVSRFPGVAEGGGTPANGQSIGRSLGAGCADRGPWRLQAGGSSTPGLLE